MKIDLFKIAVLVTVALLLTTLQYRLRILNEPNAHGPYATTRIGEFKSEPPYQRRVLAPLLAVQAQRLTGIGLDEIEFVGRFLFLSATLIAANALISGLMGSAAGMIGALLLAALLPLGFFMNQMIDSYPAMLTLLLGLLAMHYRKFLWLIPIIAIGTFFRETTALLIFVFLLAPLPDLRLKQKWLWLAAFLATYIAIRVLLRALFPGGDFVFSLWYNLWHLLGEPAAFLSRAGAVLAPFVLTIWALKHAVGLARSMAITGLVYGFALLFVGRFDETRIFYEIYVLLVPAIVAGVLPALRDEIEAARAV